MNRKYFSAIRAATAVWPMSILALPERKLEVPSAADAKPSPNMSFSDKQARIISGGSGMGLETAMLLVRAGASVTIVGRRLEKWKTARETFEVPDMVPPTPRFNFSTHPVTPGRSSQLCKVS